MSGQRHTFRGGPLGNFARSPIKLPCPFTGEMAIYATVEHYFQACKATTLADHEHVRSEPTPRAAKRAGRRIRLRPDWEEAKVGVMLTALRAKFRTPTFGARLVATGDLPLAEDSPTDFEWGGRDLHGGWNGENLLGRLLMQVREELRTVHRAGPAVSQLALPLH